MANVKTGDQVKVNSGEHSGKIGIVEKTNILSVWVKINGKVHVIPKSSLSKN